MSASVERISSLVVRISYLAGPYRWAKAHPTVSIKLQHRAHLMCMIDIICYYELFRNSLFVSSPGSAATSDAQVTGSPLSDRLSNQPPPASVKLPERLPLICAKHTKHSD